MRERVVNRLLGLGFIVFAVVCLLVAVAFYNKDFTPVDHVTLQAQEAGLNLLPNSDVKERGLIVGYVKSIDETSYGAAIHLNIYPGDASLIPSNVSAQIVPKTLFGEKEVNLILPAPGLRSKPIAGGDVIPLDRSSESVEVTQLLNDVLPLLTAVQPAKLNATLNALAVALEGRGTELGETISEADSYLKTMNPELPTLLHDVNALGAVSQNLDNSAPALLKLMRNVQVTSTTIVQKEPQLLASLTKGISLTGNATPFLEQNANKIIGVEIANVQTLGLIAKYSVSIPCVFEAQEQLQPRLIQAMGGGQPGVHVTLELVKPRPGYKPGLDTPEYADQRNPRCYGLPNPKVPFPQYQLLDGTQDDQWWKSSVLPTTTPTTTPTTNPSKKTAKSGTSSPTAKATPTPTASADAALSSLMITPTSSTGNDELMADLLGPVLGEPSADVPDWQSLLFEPAANGMMVNLG
jgi:phospholipid/cholesterol/gamma-HCH transport system substrate-binding protein